MIAVLQIIRTLESKMPLPTTPLSRCLRCLADDMIERHKIEWLNEAADLLEEHAQMKKAGIPVKGIKVDDSGDRPKIINKPPRMSVSQKIRQGKSKRVKVSKRVKGAQKP